MPPARRPPAQRRRPPQREASEASGRQRASGRDSGGAGRRRGRGGPARPRGRGSDLAARVLVAVPAAIVAIIFVDLGGLAFALFLALIGLVCLHELYGLLARWKPLPIVGFASLIGMILAARYGSARVVLEVAVATFPVVVLAVFGRPQRGGSTVAVAGTLLGVFWVGLAFAHAVLLRQLPHGGGVVIDILVGTFLGDTGAYVGGRLFGRRPLAPSISPQKTVEGLGCGMLIAIVAVFFAGLYQDWLTQGDALLLGLAVAILGPLGDLFESVVKRDAAAKDAGSLFGAHGGALDRLDAVIFTIVAGYYIWLGVMQ